MFFDDAFMFSKLEHAELYFENIKTDMAVKLYYRSESGYWYLGGEGEFKVPYYTSTVHDALPQARNKINIPLLSSTCDPMTRADTNRGSMFQFCIEMTGVGELTKLWFVNKKGATTTLGDTRVCETETENLVTAAEASVILNDYDYFL
jgi:hypothetical protein